MTGSHFCRVTGHPDKFVVGAVALLELTRRWLEAGYRRFSTNHRPHTQGLPLGYRSIEPIGLHCHRCTETISRFHHLGLTSGKLRFKITQWSHSQGLTSGAQCFGTTHRSRPPGLTPGYRPFKATYRDSWRWDREVSKTSITNYHPTLRHIQEQQRPQLHSGKSHICRRFVVTFSVRLGQARLAFHAMWENSAKFGLHARQHEISVLPRNNKYTYVYNYM